MDLEGLVGVADAKISEGDPLKAWRQSSSLHIPRIEMMDSELDCMSGHHAYAAFTVDMYLQKLPPATQHDTHLPLLSANGFHPTKVVNLRGHFEA